MGDLGKLAYENYCETTDWKSLISGDSLPSWEYQLENNPKIAEAWENAAQAVAKHVVN